MTETENSRVKRIGTHDGKFHADEALACALLQMTDEFARSGRPLAFCAY